MKEAEKSETVGSVLAKRKAMALAEEEKTGVEGRAPCLSPVFVFSCLLMEGCAGIYFLIACTA